MKASRGQIALARFKIGQAVSGIDYDDERVATKTLNQERFTEVLGMTDLSRVTRKQLVEVFNVLRREYAYGYRQQTWERLLSILAVVNFEAVRRANMRAARREPDKLDAVLGYPGRPDWQVPEPGFFGRLFRRRCDR